MRHLHNWQSFSKRYSFGFHNKSKVSEGTTSWYRPPLLLNKKCVRFFSASKLTTKSAHPCQIAIVGTGPSGCYTAKYILSWFDKKGKECRIDMLERLPTPYGLVRYGVAPDHPEVKNVENDFAALFQDKRGQIKFWGNVHVGDTEKGVSVNELRQLYDAVVLAYGCESDRKLGIPREDSLRGVLSAREFVAWYNGHPNFGHIGDEVAQALDGSTRREVVVIGQGNVALDCARILSKGAKGLHDTDIASRALPIIGDEGVSKVTVMGRRGHVQGAFTIKELRELSKLEEEGYDARFIVRENELDLGLTASSQEELSQKGSRPKVRIDKLLRDAAVRASKNGATTTSKQVCLRFLLSPKSFEPSEIEPSMVGSVVCERTELEGDPGGQRAVGTNMFETVDAQLVLVSIGYKGVPLPGIEHWFDDVHGIVKNMGGRVDGFSSSMGGLYVAGWLKRGPSGIIGTNIVDAKDTVATLVIDLKEKLDSEADRNKRSASDTLVELFRKRNVRVITWSEFENIDAEERSATRKRCDKQPREKLVDLDHLLAAAKLSAT